MRYVSITTYAKMCGISRESVYKRIKKGTAILLDDCEVSVIDTYRSRGKMQRNDFTNIKTDNNLDWL
jgi:predicted DNA-binding protein YlxM (UPF0122 family)